jgi:hypothetical protein
MPKKDVSELSNTLKTIFCLPKVQDFKTIDSKVISLDEYINIAIEKNKRFNDFFVLEMRRLLAFRHLMCLTLNQSRNFYVYLVNNSEEKLISRLDFPLSMNEKKFCYDAFDKSCRIPKTMIKEWFNNSEELVYDTVKDLLLSNDIDSSLKLKYTLIEAIKENDVYNDQNVWWVNAIVEQSRKYLD